MQLFLFLIEVGVVLFRQIAVSRKRESYGKIRLRECERKCPMRNLPFPASGSPTARFAYANANDGKLRLPRRFRVRGYKTQKKTPTKWRLFCVFGSPMRNRTADSAVRGQRLNRLTMRPSDLFKLSYFKVSYVMITYFFYYCNCLPAFQGKNKIIF